MNKIYIRGNEIATKEYVDSLSFGGGDADLSNYYTKEEINNIISETNNSIQVEEMPDASEENVGTIVQYVGITNKNYTTSNFYQVVEKTIINEDGSETTIYVWEEILTPEINLDEYATKKYVDDSLNNIPVSDIPMNIRHIHFSSYAAGFMYGSGIALSADEKQVIEDIINEQLENLVIFLTVGDQGVANSYSYLLHPVNKPLYFPDTNTNHFYEFRTLEHLFNVGQLKLLDPGLYVSGSWTDGKFTVNNAKLNSQNIYDMYTAGQTRNNFLSKTNTTEFIPTGDYNPATKKYVDDAIMNAEEGGNDYIPTFILNTGSTTDIFVSGITMSYSKYPEILQTFSEFLTECYAEGHDIINIVLKTSNNNTLLFNMMKSSFQTKPTYLSINALYFQNRTLSPDNNNPLTIIQGVLRMTWDDNNVVTVSSFETYVQRNYLLTTKNTDAYTPTSDYNPATKKYVDDIVGNINSILDTINGEEV